MYANQGKSRRCFEKTQVPKLCSKPVFQVPVNTTLDVTRERYLMRLVLETSGMGIININPSSCNLHLLRTQI